MKALDIISRNRMIDRKELAELIPYSPSQIRRMEQAGTFPKRARLGPGRVAWSLSEVLAWIECQKEGRIWTAETPITSRVTARA